MINITLPAPTKASLDNNFPSPFCPDCDCKAHIYQYYQRKIKDPEISAAIQIRVKCPNCHKTWNIYPEGVRAYSPRSLHLVVLSVILYSFGLSHSKVDLAIQAFTRTRLTSATSSWRDFQRTGAFIKLSKLFSNHKTPISLSIDGTYIHIKGESSCLTMVSNPDGGSTLIIDLVDERAEAELAKMFFSLTGEFNLKGVKLLVSDGNPVIRKLVDNLNGFNPNTNRLSHFSIKHTLCLFHAKQALSRRLRKFLQKHHNLSPPQVEVINYLQQLKADSFPFQKQNEVRQLSLDLKLAGELELADIVRDVYLNYEKYSAYQLDKTIPKTNNVSERNFVESKQRYKLTRGFGSKSGCLNFFNTITALNNNLLLSEEYFQFI